MEVKFLDMEKMEEWIEEDKRSVEVNTRAMNTLLCALCPKEFNSVSTCKTTKAICHKLKVTHEGIKQVKEIKINLLIHDYKLFIMKENEYMKEMFTRFNDIIIG